MSTLRRSVSWPPPTWTGVPSPSFTFGTAATYNLAALVTEPSGLGYTLSVVGTLPTGVTLSGTSLVYSGSGTSGATASVQIRATNAGGSADSAAFAVTLTATGGPAPLLAPSDITYLGYYDLALGIGDPFYGMNMTLRTVSGQERLIMSIFNFNGASTRTIAEVSVTGRPLNTAITSTTNTWNVSTASGPWFVSDTGDKGQGYTFGVCEQIMWDAESSQLLRTTMVGYPGSSFFPAVLDVLSMGAGGNSITRVKRLTIGTLADGRINGGHCLVPQAFRTEFGVGKIALGTGGYRSNRAQVGTAPEIGAPEGLTTHVVQDLAQYADGAVIPFQTLATHNTANPGMRMYFAPTFTQTGTKTFTAQECNAPGGRPEYIGVSVPSGTFVGPSGSSQLWGPLDHEIGGDPRGNPFQASEPTWRPLGFTGNSGVSGVEGVGWGQIAPNVTRWNSVDFYAGKAWLYGPPFTKRGIIAAGTFGLGHTWYGSSSVGSSRRGLQMHIFDPVHLGEVARGQRAASSIQPVAYRDCSAEAAYHTEFGAPPAPSMTFSETTKRIYVYWPVVNGGISTRILVYQVNA